MADKKSEPSTSERVTQGSPVRLEVPAGTRVRTSRHRRQTVVDLVSPDEFVGGFVDFLREHAIVGLAVGFAIGSQAQTLVKTLVSSFIDPTFQLLFGKALSNRTFTLHFHHHYANFGWGAFLYGFVDFIFVLAAIYMIVKLFNLDKLDKPQV